MLIRTKALVLHSIKYTENSVILHAYTEEHGRMAYVVNGVKSKKSVLRSALLQPLTILELETDYKPNKDLHHIKESRLAYHFTSIPYDASKNALVLFIAELLYRSLKEPHIDKDLYNFLAQSICVLDLTETGIGNFHLVFMIQLTRFLGFEPHAETISPHSYFDLHNGVFISQQGFSPCLSLEDSSLFASLTQVDYDKMGEYRFTKEEKSRLLNALLAYYKLHLSNFTKIKSVEVMIQLFS